MRLRSPCSKAQNSEGTFSVAPTSERLSRSDLRYVKAYLPSSRMMILINENPPFSQQDELTTDFCYGFLTFPKITLSLPGGINFDLMKYWDGQPVRFVCCERNSDAAGRLEGPGRTFLCVVLEVVDDAESALVGTRSTNGGHNT